MKLKQINYWITYELMKKKIIDKKPTPTNYEQEINELVTMLGI